MKAPGFWAEDGFLPHLLSPAGMVFAAITRARVRRPGFRADVPVICCGGATVGGAGKTTVAIALIQELLRQGSNVHALTRGYGGRAVGPLRVDSSLHDARMVGDEALLLAELVPCWVARNRAAGARAAVAAGAQAIILDDGLQNPTLQKDLSFLVIDGATGFGNGRAMPAGPLRETVADAASRCGAAVLIGADHTGALARLPAGLPVLRASLQADSDALFGRRVYALAGIALPGKFHASLCDAGAQLVGHADFPDHHVFTDADLTAVWDAARHAGACLVTTRKDAVRLPPLWRDRVLVFGITLRWRDPAMLRDVLARALP